RRKRMVSPGNAPATNAVLPPRTTPSPSCVREATVAVSSGAGADAGAFFAEAEPFTPRPSRRTIPRAQEFREVRLGAGAQQRPHPLHLLGVTFACEPASHQLESQVDEISVENVRLAVAPDPLQVSGKIRLPHPGAGESQLSRQAQQVGHTLQ